MGLLDVSEKEDLIITCKSGVTIRMKVEDISELGRATQGVKLIRLDNGDEIAAITRMDEQIIEEVVEELLEEIPAENIEEVSTESTEEITGDKATNDENPASEDELPDNQ